MPFLQRRGEIAVHLADTNDSSVELPTLPSVSDTSAGAFWCQLSVIVKATLSGLESSFIAGFQLAVGFGPLCGEPLCGVGFILEEVELSASQDSLLLLHDLSHVSDSNLLGPMAGHIVAAMKEGCVAVFGNANY